MPTSTLRAIKIVLGIGLLFTTNALQAQDNSNNQVNWQLDATVQGVSFFHAVISCNGSNVVLLKFENRNSYPVKISWKEKFTTQLEVKKEGFGGMKEMILPRGITMPSSCSDASDKKKIVRSTDVNPSYVAEISDFEFFNIAVIKAN